MNDVAAGEATDLAAKHALADQLIATLTSKVAEAEQLKSDIQAAKVKAEADCNDATKAKDAAVQASTDAASAKGAAETERDNAVAASAAVTTAKDNVTTQAEAISQAGKDVNAIKTLSEGERDKTIAAREATDIALFQADLARKSANERADAAEKEAEKAREAHNMSTTAGLAGAFNIKAKENRDREWIWFWSLVAALIAAAIIGFLRFKSLSDLIASSPSESAIAAELILSLFGLGPPVWLAWLSSQMISKNLAVTQDYAYKAALAQAYVGFKDQARDLNDPLFEQRLFAAAITQLDASPVRLLGTSHPGSPMQDFLQQPFVRELVEQNPTFKEHLSEWLKHTVTPKIYKKIGGA